MAETDVADLVERLNERAKWWQLPDPKIAAEFREAAAALTRLREALVKIADENYEPIGESFTTAAAAIARAALDTGEKP